LTQMSSALRLAQTLPAATPSAQAPKTAVQRTLSATRTLGTAWLDAVAGAVFGFAVLHPLAMWIVGAHQLAEDGGGFVIHMLSPMAAYFTAVGLTAGLVSGWFRAKVVRQNAQLAVQRDALRNAVADRETLLRVLTHDLSSSVGSSATLLEIALEPDDNGAIHPDAGDLQAASRGLQGGVELIKFTRTLLAIESGKMEVPLGPYDVGQLLQESTAVFRRKQVDKGIHIELLLPDSPAVALVEPVTFKNCIVNNLLSNAMKFSLPGGCVSIELQKRAGIAVVSVTNAGVIPAGRIERLFDVTGRTSSAGTSGEMGTGFGLPLARKFAELMAARLAVRSDAQTKCTTVSLEIPVIDS